MTEAELHKKLKYEKRRDAIGRVCTWTALISMSIFYVVTILFRFFSPALYQLWLKWGLLSLGILFLVSLVLACILDSPGFKQIPVSKKGEYCLKPDGLFYLSRKGRKEALLIGRADIPAWADAVSWLPFSKVKGILISNGSRYGMGRFGYYHYLTEKKEGKQVIIPWISLFDREPEMRLLAWWESKEQHKKTWKFYHGVFQKYPGEYLRNLEAENLVPGYRFRRYRNKANWDVDTGVGFLYGFPLSEAFWAVFCKQYQGTYYIAQSVFIQHSDEMARLIKDFGIEKERIHVVKDMEFADGEKEI